MINLLGQRIVFIIVFATLLLSAAGATSYYYLSPEQVSVEREQKSLKGKISTKRAEIAQLKEQYLLLKDQILKFNLLKKKGFFNAQDRVTARETISELTRQARLMRADLTLSPAVSVTDKNAESANHVLISGPMEIKIGSLNDVNVFKYMVALQNVFPGYLEFRSFDFHRSGSRDAGKDGIENLVKTGKQSLIEGNLQFTWWSMASPEQMAASPYFNPTAVSDPVPDPAAQPGATPTVPGGAR